MKKVIIIALLVTIPAALIGISVMQRLLAGREEEEAKGVPVRIMKPRRGRIERTAGYPGNLFPKRTVTVLSKIPGKVDRILVGKGDLVKDEQVIALIEDETINLRMDQAYSALQAAEARYEKARKGLREQEIENARALGDQAEKDLELARENFKRTKRLYDKGAIAKSRYEEAEAALRSAQTAVDNAARTLELMEEGASEEDLSIARANVSAMRAQYELARLQMDYAEIKAPLEGIVADVLVDEGNMVGQTVALMLIVQDNPIVARISVPEIYYGEIAGRQKEIGVKIRPIALADSKPFSGTIAGLDPVIDAVSRTFELEVDVENESRLLRPGMYINAEIILETREEALLIPTSALLSRDERYIVYTVEQSNPVPTAKEKVVQVGLEHGGWVQIISGLLDSDRIIVEGNAFLENGQEINIIAAP